MKNFYIFCTGLFLLAMGTFVISGQMQSNQTQTTDMKKSQKQDKFWTEAAQGGMTEVALSNLALQKSQNEDVKKYAQMMVDDHTKANDELKTLAESKSVTLPTAINAKQMAMRDKLNGLSGDAFDKEYINMMVKDHDKTVKLFQTEADKGSDTDVKAFASNTLPTLKSHQTMAHSMSDSMKGKKSDSMNGNKGMKNMNSNSNSGGSSNTNSNSNNM